MIRRIFEYVWFTIIGAACAGFIGVLAWNCDREKHLLPEKVKFSSDCAKECYPHWSLPETNSDNPNNFRCACDVTREFVEIKKK